MEKLNQPSEMDFSTFETLLNVGECGNNLLNYIRMSLCLGNLNQTTMKPSYMSLEM